MREPWLIQLQTVRPLERIARAALQRIDDESIDLGTSDPGSHSDGPASGVDLSAPL